MDHPPPLVMVPPKQQPAWRRRRLWIGVAVLAVALAGGAHWQRQHALRARNVLPFTVQASSGTLPGLVTATGEVDAVERVNVSPKRQGVLQQLYVDEGDRVKQGQPLARMDDGDLRDRIQEYQANLSSAEASLIRSRSEWQRRQQLYSSGAISADDYNRALGTYRIDLSAVSAARQRLDQREVERGELVVRAPFDGMISQRYADPGAFVTPTTSASTTAGATSSSIVELAQGMEVVAKVPENDLGRLRRGMAATVRVDAFPDRRFAARIRQIAPRAIKTNNVTSFEVKLELPEPAPELRIGMTADISFQTGRLRADTLIPTVAVVTEEGKPGVLVVGKDKQPTFRPVELGISGGKQTQILSGLRAGERVFIDLPPWSDKKGRQRR